MSKILLNEPDNNAFLQYQSYLSRYGFETEQLTDPLNWAQYHDAVAVIIDGHDTVIDKYIVEIRKHFLGGLLVSTSNYDNAKHIINLELGADDVLPKQAQPRMLAARLNALIRRIPSQKQQEYSAFIRVGKLELDGMSRSCSFNADPITLTSHEFELLLILAQNAGKVVSRDQLFTALLGRPYDGVGRSVDVRISKLRKKLSDNEANPEKIKTIWKQGYCLILSAFD